MPCPSSKLDLTQRALPRRRLDYTCHSTEAVQYTPARNSFEFVWICCECHYWWAEGKESLGQFADHLDDDKLTEQEMDEFRLKLMMEASGQEQPEGIINPDDIF